MKKIWIAIVLLIPVTGYCGKVITQNSDWMEPTVLLGQEFELRDDIDGSYSTKRFDIVVYKNVRGTLVLGRIGGMPKEKFKIGSDGLYSNGKKIEIPPNKDGRKIKYIPASVISGKGDTSFDTYTIPDGHYYLLCDNSAKCSDSRFYGLVKRVNIISATNL